MNKKRIIIHIVVTDAISVGISILTLAVSSIISAILYVGSKKK